MLMLRISLKELKSKRKISTIEFVQLRLVKTREFLCLSFFFTNLLGTYLLKSCLLWDLLHFSVIILTVALNLVTSLTLDTACVNDNITSMLLLAHYFCGNFKNI